MFAAASGVDADAAALLGGGGGGTDRLLARRASAGAAPGRGRRVQKSKPFWELAAEKGAAAPPAQAEPPPERPSLPPPPEVEADEALRRRESFNVQRDWLEAQRGRGTSSDGGSSDGGSKPPSEAGDAPTPSVAAADVRGMFDGLGEASSPESGSPVKRLVSRLRRHSAAPSTSTAAPSTPPRTPPSAGSGGGSGGKRRVSFLPSRRGSTGSSPEPKSPPWAPGATEAAAARVRMTTADFGV